MDSTKDTTGLDSGEVAPLPQSALGTLVFSRRCGCHVLLTPWIALALYHSEGSTYWGANLFYNPQKAFDPASINYYIVAGSLEELLRKLELQVYQSALEGKTFHRDAVRNWPPNGNYE